MRPVLLVDCNLEPTSGQTFHASIARWASPETLFVRRRIPEGEGGDWVREVQEGYYSRLIVSGSAASIDSGPTWVAPLAAALREATSSGVPTLGICFGHQLLARAWGATIEEDRLGYKIRGVQAVTIKDIERPPFPLIPGGRGELEVLSSHRDQVSTPPPGWQIVARSSYCPIQALRAPSLPILTVQWHPEGDGQFILDNPHPSWDHLATQDLVGLTGNSFLASFLEGKDPPKESHSGPNV